VAVSWVGETIDGRSPVYVRALDAEGATGPVLKAGTTEQLRVFPQLAVSGDSAIIVWTDDVNGGRVMKAVTLPWKQT
jgi:hypothetical protein